MNIFINSLNDINSINCDLTNKTRVENETKMMKKQLLSSCSLLKVLPWKKATDYDSDEVYLEKQNTKFDPKYIGGTTSIFNAKDLIKCVKFPIGIFDMHIEFLEKKLETMQTPQKYMNSKIDIMVRKLGTEIERALLYNINSDENNSDMPKGLFSYYNAITDIHGNVLDKDGRTADSIETSPLVCLDALGGKNNNKSETLSSILLVYPDATDGLCLIYPHESQTYGIEYKAPIKLIYYKTKDELVFAKHSSIMVSLGISLNRTLACTRIANIDTEDEKSLKTAIDLIVEAYEHMRPLGQENIKIFAPLKAINAIRKLEYSNTIKAPIGRIHAFDLDGNTVKDTNIFTVCHSMSTTERRVKTVDE